LIKRIKVKKTGLSIPDVLALTFILAVFVSFFLVARYWSGPLHPPPPIDLSLGSLPYAVFLSLSRIGLAYLVCLVTSLGVGYWAAHSRTAEKIIIPLIDIGQSVPVLAFLPGLVLVFVSLFPDSRVGLEITAVLTLYTGMAWNMMFGFYASLKTIPREYLDTIRAYGYGRLGILLRLELPYSMNVIVWNSMLSVAGGWFFLTVCESYNTGSQSFRLVGLGSFMTLAADKGDYTAMLAGGGVMLLILVATDFFLWNPLLRWAERFQRMEPLSDGEDDEPVLNFFAKSHRITSFVRKMRIRYAVRFYVNKRRGRRRLTTPMHWEYLGWAVGALFVAASALGTITAIRLVALLKLEEWRRLLVDAFLTFIRVNAVVAKRLQPVIQVIAAFPAPMVFPLFMAFFLWASIPLSFGSVVLMMTGAQWYLLFNVISGTAGVPERLVEAARITGMNRLGIMRRVYFPAAFPQILTGLITAAGGAWNVSIVAELVVFRGQEYSARGLGAYMMSSFQAGNYPALMAAIIVMIVLIVIVNRFFWARLYELAESKYRMDG
jgi:NitT/TauT family transport system permease protein